MISDQHASDASIPSPGAADWKSTDGGLSTSASTMSVGTSGRARDAIAVIDRRTFARDVLTRSLQLASGFRIINAFSSIDEWMLDGSVHQTSVVLLGVGDADGSEQEVVADLRCLADHYPDTPVIVVGNREDAAQVGAILSQGVRGYIPTSMSLSAVVAAISLVAAGGEFAPACALLDAGGPGTKLSARAGAQFGLTGRQQAIAEQIAKGKPNKIIAFELNLSESTVKVHVRTIMKKLGARNRTEVAFKLHAARTGPAARAL